MRTLRNAILLLLLAALLASCGSPSSPLSVAGQATVASLPTEAQPARTLTPMPPADTPPPDPSPAATTPPAQVQITIVYDNTAVEPGLDAEWGFAAWINYGDQDILFDTGPGGAMLLGNLEQLGFDPAGIDLVILSHEHDDHTGGAISLLQTGVQPTLYVPSSFSLPYKRQLGARSEVVEVKGPLEILPGLYSTGELATSLRGQAGALKEQALVIETSAGSVVITGCAHPGIVPIVRAAQQIVPGEVALVMGGFHLLDKTSSAVEAAAASLRELGVREVSPTHCTGEQAIAIFASAYGDDYTEGGAGRVYRVGGPSLGSTMPGLEALAILEGLSFDDPLGESNMQLLLRSPKTIAALGLAEEPGQRNDRLDDPSDAYPLEMVVDASAASVLGDGS